MQTKVSILTPCYNGEKYLHRYFESILNQTYKNYELIFVNDGSTDNTEKIALEYKKKLNEKGISMIYIYQKNAGQAAAVNNGLKKVTGEYLIWPDADDYFEYDALEILSNVLDSNPTHAYVRGNVLFRNSETLEVIEEPKPAEPTKEYLFEDYLFCTKNVCCFSGVIMMRMDVFEKMNRGRDIFTPRTGQNWQLLLPITYNNKGLYVDKTIYNYLVINSSHSHSIKGKDKELKRQDDCEDLLIKMLGKIEMPDFQRNLYLKQIKKKYKKERMHVKMKYTKLYKILRSVKHAIFR